MCDDSSPRCLRARVPCLVLFLALSKSGWRRTECKGGFKKLKNSGATTWKKVGSFD